MNRSAVLAGAEARLRQLCCLGLPGPVVAPMLFRELNRVLPFETCVHIWVGPQGPFDVYVNAPEILASFALYRDSFFGAREAEVWPTIAEAARTEVGPHHVNQVLRISKAAYRRHPICNEILRPCGGEVFLRMMVRDRGVPVGAFNVARASRDRDFDDEDLQTLRRLEPFIVHALRSRDGPVGPQTCSADRALIVVDAMGNVCWRSPQADRLLSLSHGSSAAPATLPQGLLQAASALGAIAQPEARTPTWRCDNAWGSFVARAYPLEPTEPAPALIGIELERRVPLALQLFEAVREVPVPARQAEVCLLLALGRTQEQIAGQLGVSRNTVVYHRRQIYNRLGVDSRPGLRERLLQQP